MKVDVTLGMVDKFLFFLIWIIVFVFGCAILKEGSPCSTVCEIRFCDGTEERIMCRYAEVDENVLEIRTDDGRVYKPLSAIKSVTTYTKEK